MFKKICFSFQKHKSKSPNRPKENQDKKEYSKHQPSWMYKNE